MGLSDVQITILVGLGVRVVLWVLISALQFVRSDNTRSRSLVLSWFLVTSTFVGAVAEYFDLGLRYARLTEVTVSGFFVAAGLATLFKLDPAYALRGIVGLVMFCTTYTLAAVTVNDDLEVALLVIGAIVGVAALLSLRFSVPHNYMTEFVFILASCVFYFVMVLQTVFGPWVLADWDRLTWAIVWEVAITLFVSFFAIASWFAYTAGSPDCAFASDLWDAAHYWFTTNRWAPPPAKQSD